MNTRNLKLLIHLIFFIFSTIFFQSQNSFSEPRLLPNSYNPINHPLYHRDTVLELNQLSENFNVLPGFFLLDDLGSPNAYATPESYDNRFPDGSVMFGVSLMRAEYFSKNNNGYNTSVPAIMAHEFAHIKQFSEGIHSEYPVPIMELHADFMAGWYLKNRRMAIYSFPEHAFESIYNKGDYEYNNPNHHGTPEERLAATREGFKNGSLSGFHAFQYGLEWVVNNFPEKNISINGTINWVGCAIRFVEDISNNRKFKKRIKKEIENNDIDDFLTGDSSEKVGLKKNNKVNLDEFLMK